MLVNSQTSVVSAWSDCVILLSLSLSLSLSMFLSLSQASLHPSELETATRQANPNAGRYETAAKRKLRFFTNRAGAVGHCGNLARDRGTSPDRTELFLDNLQRSRLPPLGCKLQGNSSAYLAPSSCISSLLPDVASRSTLCNERIKGCFLQGTLLLRR
jgi:hypothetical protein